MVSLDRMTMLVIAELAQVIYNLSKMESLKVEQSLCRKAYKKSIILVGIALEAISYKIMVEKCKMTLKIYLKTMNRETWQMEQDRVHM